MGKIGIRFERSTEINIRILSGDSLIRHGGTCNCGGTAPLILSSELDKGRGKSQAEFVLHRGRRIR
jgi:hypothetical protein